MIPKIIHQIWFGKEQYKPIKLMKKWSLKHPNWDYFFWNEKSLFKLKNKDQYDWCNKLGIKGKMMQSDLVRYEILNKFGGIYIDADSECLKPLEDKFLDNEFFASMLPDGYEQIPAIHILGSVPNHKMTCKMIDFISNIKKEEMENRNHYGLTGNGAFNHVMIKENIGIKIYPSQFFIPIEEDKSSFIKHHWGHKGMNLKNYEKFSLKSIKIR